MTSHGLIDNDAVFSTPFAPVVHGLHVKLATKPSRGRFNLIRKGAGPIWNAALLPLEHDTTCLLGRESHAE